MPTLTKEKKKPPVVAQKAAAKIAAGSVMTKADRSQVRAILQEDATMEKGKGGAEEEAKRPADDEKGEEGPRS